MPVEEYVVLNLVISGIPSILKDDQLSESDFYVLNLVISGIPSIPEYLIVAEGVFDSFKPCYKWNTFNTIVIILEGKYSYQVLNLVISGIPSIHFSVACVTASTFGFKPCYKWNTFNT